MFSISKKHSSADRAAIDAFFAAGGQVTMCPPRRASARSDSGWNRLNDKSRATLGLAVG